MNTQKQSRNLRNESLIRALVTIDHERETLIKVADAKDKTLDQMLDYADRLEEEARGAELVKTLRVWAGDIAECDKERGRAFIQVAYNACGDLRDAVEFDHRSRGLLPPMRPDQPKTLQERVRDTVRRAVDEKGPREVARYVGVSEPTVKSVCGNGKLQKETMEKFLAAYHEASQVV